MVTEGELDLLRARVASEGDLPALLRRLVDRAAPLLARRPPVPQVKARLTVDGGVCPACGAPLRFDPWEPEAHACSGCAAVARGPRHHAHWARTQHLWLAERAAHLAAAGVLGDDERLAAGALEVMRPYHDLYHALPNRDNVLGPAHLFFSTYLESMWVLNWLAAAHLLRARGWLPEPDEEAVNGVADEAANLIADFNEGMSNRQTWHAAALTAIGVWFGDAELAATAIQGPTGLLAHLTDGFGDDGMWYEGENYHLFALRGLLTGIHWARAAGTDLLENPELAEHLGHALLAPAATALPDLTFPARRDARFGVSLAHPASVECWEAGLALLGDAAPAELAPWLHALYRTPPRPAATYDAWLHDAGEPAPAALTRSDLSWWMLVAMRPSLPADTVPWQAPSVLLPAQGVGVLRLHGRYASLELGGEAGGHGHPDRLHLTVHDGTTHWLADPGAGSYVARDLFWYRSTLAHNAPRRGGRSQGAAAPAPRAFEVRGEWGWIQGEWEGVRRSVVQAPGWLLDQLDAAGDGLLELPWHFRGEVTVESAGRWAPGGLDDPFVRDAATFTPDVAGPVRVRVADASGRSLTAWLAGGDLVRARCPGLPGGPPATMLLLRAPAAGARLVALLDQGGGVTAVDATAPEHVAVTDSTGRVAVSVAPGAAAVDPSGGERVTLRGAAPAPVRPRRMLAERFTPPVAAALRVDRPPALDGSLDGFDLGEPIDLADEAHYRRSEEPYAGPDAFAATAWLNWDERALYVAVEVAKTDLVVRRPGDPPLGLDNEPDDIHSDGIQVYVRLPGGEPSGWLVRPAPEAGVVARPIPGAEEGLVPLAGATAIGENGYVLTVALPLAGLEQLAEPRLDFELVVNEMRAGRERRAGQLAWAGGGGWVYLRGDRADPAQFGVLELAG
jgi:hypothetical protein